MLVLPVRLKMPTIILLDASASLLRPADAADPSTTRQDVVQRGVLHFLQCLEKMHEFEPIALLTYSTSCRVVVPFTTNHAELRKALYEVTVQSAGRVMNALETACQYMEDQCGRRASGCQVVEMTAFSCLSQSFLKSNTQRKETNRFSSQFPF